MQPARKGSPSLEASKQWDIIAVIPALSSGLGRWALQLPGGPSNSACLQFLGSLAHPQLPALVCGLCVGLGAGGPA